MNKRDLILDTMLILLAENKGDSCSVSDIAKKAGIAKGGMYYYFNSKEEVFDALVERTYQKIILECQNIVNIENKNALEKLEQVYTHYRSSVVSCDLNAYLHHPKNAYIHQKSLAKILTSFSPIIAQIIEQGNKENIFHCLYPLEFSEIVLSVFCFLFDPGIFQWSQKQLERKLLYLVSLMESGLGVSKGSIDFFIKY